MNTNITMIAGAAALLAVSNQTRGDAPVEQVDSNLSVSKLSEAIASQTLSYNSSANVICVNVKVENLLRKCERTGYGRVS